MKQLSHIGLRVSDWPLTIKLIVFTLLAAIIPTIIIGSLAISRTTELLERDAFAAENAKVEQGAADFENFFAGLKADAVFLANSSPLTQLLSVTDAYSVEETMQMIEAGDPTLDEVRTALAEEMIALMKTNDFYFKTRYIDFGGQEIVEVSQQDGAFEVSSFAKLQDEGSDDYVTEGRLLAAGEVFAGRFKLETQNDIIVEPVIPALRFSTPVYHNGAVTGVIVTNVDLDKLLAPALADKNLLAVDPSQEGMYLTHSDITKVFGADLETGESFLNDFPTAVEQISDNEQGVVVLDDGRLLSFVTAYPLLDGETAEAARQVKILTVSDRADVLAPVARFRITFFLILTAVLLITIVLAYMLAQGLLRQLDSVQAVFQAIEQENLDVRAKVLSSDELGQVATGLNGLLDRLSHLLQTTQQERDHIQSSIVNLLDEIAVVADGDLTTKVSVTQDMTGAIADSINFMIEQLRQIIGNVLETTMSVSLSAGQIQATAEHLAKGSEVQASQVIDTTAAIDEMSVSIQQVSLNATQSAHVAEQALQTAQQGTQVVQNTIAGMQRIRQQGQETAKRIKRLGESSQEVGEIVQLIRSIAKRTSILALNASLEAAAAGDAGRGFAVVAADVKRLAERSSMAADQISGLVESIQTETNGAVAAMELTTREVVEGSRLANEAGLALFEIEAVSEQLAQLIQTISAAATQQARGSETIAYSMGDIATVTQQTAAGTKEAAMSITHLSVLVDQLRQSVSTFKIPHLAGLTIQGTNGGIVMASEVEQLEAFALGD